MLRPIEIGLSYYGKGRVPLVAREPSDEWLPVWAWWDDT